jgi:hypothetical protein
MNPKMNRSLFVISLLVTLSISHNLPQNDIIPYLY